MEWDLVLEGGLLCDPKNKLEGKYDLAIKEGRIAKVAANIDRSKARQVIKLKDRVIIPGIIDSHVHLSGDDSFGFQMVAKAGVVTAIDFSGRAGSLKKVMAEGEGRGLNIGFLKPAIAGDTLTSTNPSQRELNAFLDIAQAEGALGIKILGGHYPLEPATVEALIKLAAKGDIFIASHVGTTEHGSNLEGLRETIELAAGNPLYIAHLQSYCRGQTGREPTEEALEAIELIRANPNLTAESYLSPYNGTSGSCSGGVPKSHVTRTCLAGGGYPRTEEGISQAILAGYAYVRLPRGGEYIKVTGKEGAAYWREQKTNAGLSFPVNSPSAALVIALAKDAGSFIVDILSTDGGRIPRNTLIESGLSLVRLGAITLSEFVQKAALNPAAAFGLKNKGQLGVGADADVTILDLARGKATMSIARGRIVMTDGVVVGRGGCLLQGGG